VQIMENMEWTGAAGDVAEFGERGRPGRNGLRPKACAEGW
jgi:hypothetical protein